MKRIVAKSKLHGLRVTDTNLHYEGSLTLDPELMHAADLIPGERVQVVNLNNGQRLETYLIKGKFGSGECVLNGPAALRGNVGDIVHVISYAVLDSCDDVQDMPKTILIGEGNRPLARNTYSSPSPARSSSTTMQPGLSAIVALALEEDLSRGDVTSQACVHPEATVEACIVAKASGVLAGMDAVREVARQVDDRISIQALLQDGELIEPGTVVARVTGPARSVLAFERTALNFLQQLSGVATLTRAFVERISGTKAVVADTRKTVPGLRALQKAAVVAGGGRNHRFGLGDAILIKDNHVRLAGGVREALRRAKTSAPVWAKIEVEVSTPDDAELAAELGADVIMLDNMDVETARESLNRIRGRARTEISGKVQLETIRQYAELGVDIISIGALTHSAPAVDLSLEVDEWTRSERLA